MKPKLAIFMQLGEFPHKVWYKKHPGQRMFLCLFNDDEKRIYLEKSYIL